MISFKKLLNIKLRAFILVILLFQMSMIFIIFYKLFELKIIENQYSLIALGILFLIGNLTLFFLLNKKITQPINYLTKTIAKFKDIEHSDFDSTIIKVEKKEFFKDEIGFMIEQFFEMHENIENQKSILTNLNQNLKQTVQEKIKEAQELSASLERKVLEQTKDIQEQKRFIETILDAQEQIIITTDGKTLTSANETFLDFFATDSIEDFQTIYDAKCICNTFNTEAPAGYLQIMMENERWIDYVIASTTFGTLSKVMITRGSTDFIFSVTGAKLPTDKGLKLAVFTNITEMERAKEELEVAKNSLEEVYRHTRDSIQYAALIQSALIPNNSNARKYFKDFLAIWHPKDMVGGDIYLFEELRDENEIILMVIDCTGHGVPGAFVTMVVKAIERQIIASLKYSNEPVSPAKMLQIFNTEMKSFLDQHDRSSLSNSGFDGQIVYYNKQKNILKIASARNEIFYIQENVLHSIKGDRQSVGYKDTPLDYEFSEHIIDLSKETSLYLFTDGYWDQIGGKRGFSFGKKRLKTLLQNIHTHTMADQQEELLYTLQEYQGDIENLDDITILALKIEGSTKND